MTNPIKELLTRLGVDLENSGFLHEGCEVEQEILRLRTQLSDIPTKESSDAAILVYGADHLRVAAKTLIKEGRKKELELEMRMLDKPDDVDLGADENKHLAMHLEEEQLQAEGMKRKGNAFYVSATSWIHCPITEFPTGPHQAVR